jgi:hypothetical protein
MTHIANSLQVSERNGGDDGTRTRGLCRDSERLTSSFNRVENYSPHAGITAGSTR